MAGNPRFLSEDDVQELTDYKMHMKQANVLRKHGIFFITRRDGSLKVMWAHVEAAGNNNPPAKEHFDDEEGFNWEAA